MSLKETILVVDDTENIRKIFLTAFDEYNIITAENGREALKILKKPNDVGLIVLDVMMPGINGLELLKEIKTANSRSKVVIMTAYSSKDIAIEALRANADDYIEKPFDIDEVRKIFDRLLKQQPCADNGNGHAVQDDKIRLAQRMVKRNYNRQFSLQDASKELFLNYKYLSRVFKKKTGKGFNQYRMELKISSAKQMLRDSHDNIAMIAYKVGYHNPDSFMKMFKRVTGTTPSDFRATTRNKARHEKTGES